MHMGALIASSAIAVIVALGIALASTRSCGNGLSRSAQRAAACMQLCYTEDGIVAVPLSNSSSPTSSCLLPEDIERLRCQKLGQDAAACNDACMRLAPPASFLPCATHPRVLQIAEGATLCSVERLTFDASSLQDQRNVDLAVEWLRKCGALFIRELVSPTTIHVSLAAAELFLNNSTQFFAAYEEPPDGTEDTDPGNRTGLPFIPNLRGGRFEVMLPSEPSIMSAVEAIANGAVPQILEATWDSKSELFAFLLMAQSEIAWEQPFHKDTDSIEEVKMQVALQNCDGGDGLPEFLLGSHAAAGMSTSGAQSLFPPSSRTQVRAGDAILYFSSVLHRGATNSDKRLKRLSFDAVLHSTGRFFHDSERFDEHRTHVFASGMAEFRRVWESR